MFVIILIEFVISVAVKINIARAQNKVIFPYTTILRRKQYLTISLAHTQQTFRLWSVRYDCTFCPLPVFWFVTLYRPILHPSLNNLWWCKRSLQEKGVYTLIHRLKNNGKTLDSPTEKCQQSSDDATFPRFRTGFPID